MSKDFKRRRKGEDGGGEMSSVDIKRILTDVEKALAYHPTNAQPTTPIVGGKLTELSNSQPQDAVPGFMRVAYTPVIGSNNHMTASTTNKNVARNIWSSLRNFCTTSANYQPGDVIEVLVQLGQIPAALKRIKRMMRSVFVSNTATNMYDRYLYYAVCPGATGESDRQYDIANMNRYVAEYNSLVQLYNSIAVPDFFPIFHRWEYLEEQVFADVDLETAEKQHFAQYIFFDWDQMYVSVLGDPTVNPNEFVPFSLSGRIHSSLAALRDMMNYFWDDSSLRLILGDLRNTYGSDSLYTVNAIEISEVSEWKAVFDAELLFMLYNANVVPIPAPKLTIDPASGYLEGTYIIDSTISQKNQNAIEEFIRTPKLFNAQKWGMTTEEFAKFTQWTIAEQLYTLSSGIINPGPEILTRLTIYGFQYPAGSNAHPILSHIDLQWGFNYFDNSATYTASNAASILGKMCARRAFAWAPIWYYVLADFDSSDTVTSWEITSYEAELELPVILDMSNIHQWHDAIRESVWDLPKTIMFKNRNASKS